MQFRKQGMAVAIAASLLLSACDGDDGRDGSNGQDGQDGADGPASLVVQTNLATGSAQCFYGGVRIDSGVDNDGDGRLDTDEVTETSYVCAAGAEKFFNRIASFPVCRQLDANCNTDTETAAEIVAASTDGLTLIYTDSPEGQLGFVDITDPASPQGMGLLALGGEPTSVAVVGDYALAAVNTSPDFVNVSGELAVVDIATRTIVETIALGGQPDAIAVSPDGAYAAVVIENERDEDLGDGAPPQLPAGSLVRVSLAGAPADWTTATVSLTGIADLFAGDPEPEYVDINSANIAVVTLQENNHIVLVDMADGSIVNDFSAGTVDLTAIDATEEDPALISLSEALDAVPREPDGVTWLSNVLFATADEGDLDGGSRGFTVFNTDGDVVHESGNSLDHYTVRFGHYPDGRSGNKGNEPENVDFGAYGSDHYLFVASERSSLIFVYDIADPANPVFKQVLPAAAAPEGVKTIPARNLLVAASEEDDRVDKKLRSVLNIYAYTDAVPAYPTIASVDRADQTPIPWGALSGLAASATDDNIVYTVQDSFYQRSRIFTLDLNWRPARLAAQTVITDANDVLAGIAAADLDDPTVAADDAARIDVFDEADLDALINADGTVNLDPEGIAVASDGGFWIASEGAGTVGDAGRPVNSLNFIIKTDRTGVIEEVVTLPDALNQVQLRFGFEGIAEYNGSAYVAFQRAWNGEANPRIGIYDVTAETWRFLFYPLEPAASQNGGWVGLSDLTSLGDGQFLVIERDNQGGPDAAIKRLYRFDVTDLADGSTVSKTLVDDLMDDLTAAGGLVAEKIEGSAVLANGDVLIVNDNDGVDDNSGETQLINLGDILN
ncbi:esterase-like activity of phytase family protein [Exilibacterium tricleocarpae]|uniref:Esterase-like activity of phytase family protein n=1 Tax=Exilibacterium tricleocarpae TaxID=2591008 RepID=A0A545ST79_9GAMM|nr:esterase-like activity of phytase family protein [Exilibacterium tricleocarpae]TQV68159.1 esterase-like activity of phytase family protein [Exilibacterium tricleocarpae]